MALVIDSTDPQYIAAAQRALDFLLGLRGALTYTQQQYQVGARDVIRVTEGPKITNAQGLRPHSATLVRRIIASAHWTRVISAPANDCSPDKWLKDMMWSGLKSLVSSTPDAGFVRKAMTAGRGASSVARWSGAADQTANLTTRGTIGMEFVEPYILLAHELIHADRIARGLLLSVRRNSTFLVDQRQRRDPHNPAVPAHQVNQPSFTSAQVQAGNVVKPGGTISNAGNVITQLTTGLIWVDGTMELTEEIATVGLSDDDNAVPADPLAISENMIREEHNVHKRLKYGGFNKQVN